MSAEPIAVVGMKTTMDIEIITIGDEIITGHTVDTNASYIARCLTDAGLMVRYLSSVGDSVDAMAAVAGEMLIHNVL